MGSPHSHGSTGALLRNALPEPPLPAGFARSVLRRIHALDAPWVESLRDVIRFLRHPLSMGFLSMALVAGAWDGLRHGAADARLRAERAHVMAIDPETSAFLP